MNLAHYSYCYPISSVGQVSLLPDPANLNAPYLPLEPASYSRSVQNRVHETPRGQRIATIRVFFFGNSHEPQTRIVARVFNPESFAVRDQDGAFFLRHGGADLANSPAGLPRQSV